MKKIFTLLAVALCAIGASAQTVEWTFDHDEWGTAKNKVAIAETTTYDGLTVYATTDANVNIDASNKTVDNVKYTRRLKFGGSGSFDENNVPKARVLSFDVKGKCSIYTQVSDLDNDLK